MHATLVTAPTIEPISLDEVKLHLRLDSGSTAEDEYLEHLITTAREYVEAVTRRALLTQTWDYFLSCWPSDTAILLPFGALQSVTSVKWKNSAGTEATLTVTTAYLVETNGNECGRIVLPYSTPWPSGTLYPSNPITIRFLCGWTTAALVPFSIRAATKMVCAKLYEGRGEDAVGQTVMEDKTVGRLLETWRLRDEF